LLLEILADLVVHDLGLVLRGHTGDKPLLLRFGDAELVVGVLDVLGQVLPGGRLLLRRAHEVLDVVEVDVVELGTPAGERLTTEELVALQAQVEHPLRLILLRGDVAYDFLGESALCGCARDVGVGPAEVVPAQAGELRVGFLYRVALVGRCRHWGVLPKLFEPDGSGTDTPPAVTVSAAVGFLLWSGTFVVHTPSPCAIVASRWTCCPSSRANTSVSASHSCGNSAATCATGQWC